MKEKRIEVVVRARGYSQARLELVRQEVATALANIGAFDVTSLGDFAGNGSSCDPDRMRALLRAARESTKVYVMRGK